MKKKEKTNFLQNYAPFVIRFFYIILFGIVLFGVISWIIFPDERDILNTDCRPFEASWEQILEDGTRTAIQIPCKLPAADGEVVTITTTLPDNIQTGENLCFRPIWQDVTIYIDNQLRLDYNTKASRPFGINSPMRYLFLELDATDAGKELTYHFSSTSKYAGDMRPIYIGDRLSIWTHLVETAGLRTFIAVSLFLSSMLCIFICIILKFVYRKTLPLIYLAWTIFFCAFWMLSEAEFRQILIKNISILSNYTYWCLMIIPLPLLLYINEIQNNRYRKVFLAPMLYSASILIVSTILQVFDITQFVHIIFYIHAGLLLSILCIIGTITVDTFRKRISDYLFVGIGIYGMIITAIVEMVFYYIGTNLTLGTVLAIGLMFLLIMAIIKTGQDLFASEKKRQQAILAREAQAKFLANMSHEIRTPINAIIGMNEMILRENGDETIQEYASNIQSASNMLLGLVNDVLDFSKIESGQLELVNDTYSLASLLQDEMLLLEARTAEKPIATYFDIDPALPSKYYGDELRIKQILTNLLTNAVKYTKQGSVTMRVAFRQITETDVELYFSITDTGIGIQKEDLSQLFDSFKRLEINKNRNIQGTGLGLNIAKQLVDLMKGTITVESEYGKGSTFTVVIPQQIMSRKPIGYMNPTTLGTRQPVKNTESLFTAPDARILVVDDNAMNLSLMKALLKRTKIQIDTVLSGYECLLITKSKKYDIIFMDHMMPDLDGVETLHRLRGDATNPNQNSIVIVLTANAVAGCKDEYIQYGFNDYFSKPIQAQKLEEMLAYYLSDKSIAANSDNQPENTSAEPISVMEHTPPPAPQPAGTTTESDLLSGKAPVIDPLLLEIDREIGLSYCMNMEDLYQDMLQEFCTQVMESLSQLDAYYRAKDWQNYGIIAHGLKTNSRTIGAVNFAEVSLQHEAAGKAGNSRFITEGYPSYKDTLLALKKMIQENLSK